MMKLLLINFFYFYMIYINKCYLQLIFLLMMFIMFFNFLLISMNGMFYSNLYYYMGVDYYSWGLILLSLWILILMIMCSNKIIINKFNLYYMKLILFMMIFLILCFSSMNLIMFYIYFESSLITILLLIMGWGHQVERIQASYYMMLYTLLGSLPLLLVIIYFYIIEYTLEMNLITMNLMNLYIYLSLVMAFLIKMPMFFIHLWLPKAHVEAPVIGSMVLAGVLLKLGSYGLFRVMLLSINLSLKFNKFIMIISLMGGVYSSLICLNQYDMKMLVAYSSVVHMSILLSGMMTLFNWGLLGGLMMMISHGLCSSGMFYLVNLNYERLLTRSLYINKGMINYLPSLSLMWFLLCSSNLSFPPSLNLFSEIYLFNSLILWSKVFMFMVVMISFFSATYSLYLYIFSQHGKIINMSFMFNGNFIMEFLIILLHWIPLNILFIYMFMFN